MEDEENTSFATRTPQDFPEMSKPTMVSKGLSQYLAVANQADTLCDSGINVNRIAASNRTFAASARHSFQTDFLSAQRVDEELLPRQLESIDKNLTESIKTYLSSNVIPKINTLNHLEVRDKNEFINFANCLIGGLRNFMTVAREFSSEDTNYDQMVWCTFNQIGFAWPTLYRQNASVPRAKTVPPFAILKKHSQSLNVLPRKGMSEEIPAPQSPLLPASFVGRSRLREIEGQIGDLAGALHLRLKTKQDGLRLASLSANYKVKVSIVPHETDKASLSNFSGWPSLMEMTRKQFFSNMPLHEWLFNLQFKSMPNSTVGPDGLTQACSNSEIWHFSSTECVLPVEPGTALVAGVASSKKSQKVFKLAHFLTTEPRLITIELTVLTSPYIEVDVKWLPLTQVDLLMLEKYPVSQGLIEDWASVSNMEESSPELGCAQMVRDRQRQESPSRREEAHDLDGGSDSMCSASNDPTPPISPVSSVAHPDCRKPLRAEHNISFTRTPYQTDSDNFSLQQHTMDDEQDEEDFDRSKDSEGENDSGNTIPLESLMDSVQNEVEAINREPNRYHVLLYELSGVIQGLREQLSSSSKLTTNSSERTISPRPVEYDLKKSLSMLDSVVGDSFAEFVPDVEACTPPLTSGWKQLDSVIVWHLRHVSHLIQHLASSNRFYISSPDTDSNSDNSLLCINEDLLAMALDAQSEILSDITGLVLNYGEEKDPFKVFTNSHCLGYCGTDHRAPLFPTTFWSRFVWHTSSISGSSGLDRATRLTLMIQRTSLNEFLSQEYGALDTDDEDKQFLESGKLQHELRESDEELLFRSLETLVENLVASRGTTNWRSELMALSVENFICLAHILEHEDDSVTAHARRAICALEDLTRSAYGEILQSNPLPFLRTAGPCYAFLKALDMFSQKVGSANLRAQGGSYARGRVTNAGSGYCMMSPVGTAILWAMQLSGAEDYHTAALAAWECFPTPLEISFGRSSGRPQSNLYQQQPRSGRITGGTLGSGGDQGPIQAEVRRMNLADESAKVRRMALRILMSRQKCRSIACSLNTSR
uniref:Uncharacterized protein n=1 Tax=Echinococcus canadensis TaxID=519352 RepID=A0A915F079_9CEST